MMDDELLVLTMVLGDLQKLDAQAQIRVLRYVTARLGLPLLFINARPLVPDIDRCEEIGADDYIG